MEYSDCDPDRPTTPESRLRDALEADVARHLAEVREKFEATARLFQPTKSEQKQPDLLKISLPGQWFEVNQAQLMAMNNPNHNPYYQGISAQLGTYRRGPFDDFWVW